MATHALNPAAVPAYRGGLYEWLTTTDHKKIGILYVINSFVMFLIGGVLALVVRTELAQPGLQIFAGNEHAYNEAFSIHATVMIFLFIIPMLAGLGNYAVPLMIGAPDMAFPRINALSFWMLPLGAILLLLGFFTPGGAAAAGWTSYPPLTERLPALLTWPRPGPLDRGPDPHRHELDPRRHQLPRDDLQDAGPGHDPIPDADHGLDGPRHERARGHGHAGDHERPGHALHRPELRRDVLPSARGPGDPVPERLLVLLAPGRLRHGPAGDGRDQRGPARSSAGSRSSATRRSSSPRPASARWASPSGPTTCSRPARCSCRSSR